MLEFDDKDQVRRVMIYICTIVTRHERWSCMSWSPQIQLHQSAGDRERKLTASLCWLMCMTAVGLTGHRQNSTVDTLE